MTVLHYLSYVALIIAFAFVTLSLASGLLHISELIEEHARLAKTVGQRGIYVIILLHIILYFSEALPFKHVAFSILCHVVYLQNFSSAWPLISLSSISFVSSCILVICDHFMWFFYFAKLTQTRHTSHRVYGGAVSKTPGFLEVATFFGTCVWLVPLFLFLSLSANDNALPQSDPTASQSSSSSILRTLLRRPSKRQSEGILAPPRSPSVHPPRTPDLIRRSTSPSMLHDAGPPRSPTFRPSSTGLIPPSGFSLGTPPVQRGASLTARRTSSDYVG